MIEAKVDGGNTAHGAAPSRASRAAPVRRTKSLWQRGIARVARTLSGRSAFPGWSKATVAALRAPAPVAVARPAVVAAPNNFAALRVIAALLVVYGHQTVDQTGTFGLRLVLFFAISGFLIAGSWHADPDVRRFLVRRILRVWPAYAAVIVACAAVSYVFPAKDLPEISQLASLFYLKNLWFAGFDWGFFPASNPFMNQSIWMMRFEVDIYLAFAAIAMLGRRAMTVVAGIVLLAALRAPEQHPVEGGLLECWSLYFSGFFAAGVLLRHLPALRRTGPVVLSVVAGSALLALGERTAGLLLVIPPAAVWIGEQSWPLARSATRFGDLSLGIFLWAWPVHQVTQLWLPASLPMPAQLAVVLAQVLPLAWLSWRFIEAPALRRKPTRPRRTDFDELVSA